MYIWKNTDNTTNIVNIKNAIIRKDPAELIKIIEAIRKENTELESTIDKLEDNVYFREAEIIQIVRDNWLDWKNDELNVDEVAECFESELRCL